MPATLASRLPMVIAELRPRVSAAIKSGAEDIAANARTKVPVGYPDNHLRDDIHVVRQDVAEYAISAGAEETFYGHMVEFGTKYAAPHPFLMPAAEEGVGDVAARVTAVLRSL